MAAAWHRSHASRVPQSHARGRATYTARTVNGSGIASALRCPEVQYTMRVFTDPGGRPRRTAFHAVPAPAEHVQHGRSRIGARDPQRSSGVNGQNESSFQLSLLAIATIANLCDASCARSLPCAANPQPLDGADAASTPRSPRASAPSHSRHAAPACRMPVGTPLATCRAAGRACRPIAAGARCPAPAPCVICRAEKDIIG